SLAKGDKEMTARPAPQNKRTAEHCLEMRNRRAALMCQKIEAAACTVVVIVPSPRRGRGQLGVSAQRMGEGATRRSLGLAPSPILDVEPAELPSPAEGRGHNQDRIGCFKLSDAVKLFRPTNCRHFFAERSQIFGQNEPNSRSPTHWNCGVQNKAA